MSPARGDTVRLIALKGVASDAMRAQVGELGVVQAVRTTFGGRLEIGARFLAADGVPDTYWLSEGEWVLVEQPVLPTAEELDADVEPEPMHATEEVTTVADFAIFVRKRVDQLAEDDAALAAQQQEIAARRAEIVRERRALEASAAAYGRVMTTTAAGPRAVPARGGAGRASNDGARAFLREWAAAHDGRIDCAAATAAAIAQGHTANQVGWLLRNNPQYQRVDRGVYLLRDDAA